jgi:2-keto-4-pentenoate hydratase/2-oxohepta-3-ene-1,7-dioic acid hydratase in catechol pathway
LTPDVESEAELAPVIGRRVFSVGAEDAMQTVFGYVSFIDSSAHRAGRVIN